MNNSNIVKLVHSLTVVEKQHFKKSYDSDNDFVLLFDFINKYKIYEPKKVRTYLQKKRKKNSGKTKEYSSGHLSVIKNYLQEKIMESLRRQYAPRRTSYEMITRSLNVDILLEKGLYLLVKDEIQLAKKKGMNSNFPIQNLMLFRRESIIQFYEDYANSTFEDIAHLYEKRIETAEQLLLEIKYARILTILSYQYFKGEKDLELLESFMQEDYMQDPSFAKVFGTKYLFYWVKAQFAEFQNQPKEAIQNFEKAILTWLENPDYIQAHPRMYLGACSTYMKYILQQKQASQIVLKEADLKLMLAKIPYLKLPKDVEFKWQQLFQLGQLVAYRNERQFQEIIHQAPSILQSLVESKLATDFSMVLVNYFVAVAFFQQDNYKNSNDHLHDVIHNDSINLYRNPDYVVHVFMLFLLNHYELKNFKFLKFELKKIKQQLLEKKLFGAFEDHFFKMMSQLISPRFSQQKELVFQRFRKRLHEVAKEKNYENFIEYQMILEWIGKKCDSPIYS